MKFRIISVPTVNAIVLQGSGTVPPIANGTLAGNVSGSSAVPIGLDKSTVKTLLQYLESADLQAAVEAIAFDSLSFYDVVNDDTGVLEVEDNTLYLNGSIVGGGGNALTSNPLSQFASTTSAQLRGVITDETGTGALVFANAPTLTGTTTIGVLNLGNGMIFDTSGTARMFSSSTIIYQSNSNAIQHKFQNQIGSSLTDTIVRIDTGSDTLPSGGKLLNVVGNTGSILAMCVLGTGNVGFGTITPAVKVDVVGAVNATTGFNGPIGPTTPNTGSFTNLTASGSMEFGPRTISTLPLASANNGKSYRVTDSPKFPNRLATSDGTKWHYEGDPYEVGTLVPAMIEIFIDCSTTGAKKLNFRVPVACTITGWELAGNVSGSLVLDLWKVSSGGLPALNANSIVASAKPTLTGAIQASSSTLTGWSTSLAAGDYLEVEVESASTLTNATLTLLVNKI